MNEKYNKIEGYSEYKITFSEITKNVADFINLYSQVVSYIKSLKGSLGIRQCRFIDEHFCKNATVDKIISNYIKFIKINTKLLVQCDFETFLKSVKSEVDKTFVEGFINRMKIPAKVNYSGFLKQIK